MYLEIYLKLHQCRTVNNESRGSSHGIGREEILGAAALAAKNHPVGHRLFLAENNDEKSLNELLAWVKPQLPNLYDEAVSVAMGKPTSGQLRKLVYASPGYDRERRRAAKLESQAKHESKSGNQKEADRLHALALSIREAALTKYQISILGHGLCPSCNGTKVMARKNEMCPVCGGSGKIIPDTRSIEKRYGKEVRALFDRVVEQMQFEKSDWVRMFHVHIKMECTA